MSQTGGPETVLAGEARLPFALVGFVTDHANGVMPEADPARDARAPVRRERGRRVPTITWYKLFSPLPAALLC